MLALFADSVLIYRKVRFQNSSVFIELTSVTISLLTSTLQFFKHQWAKLIKISFPRHCLCMQFHLQRYRLTTG